MKPFRFYLFVAAFLAISAPWCQNASGATLMEQTVSEALAAYSENGTPPVPPSKKSPAVKSPEAPRTPVPEEPRSPTPSPQSLAQTLGSAAFWLIGGTLAFKLAQRATMIRTNIPPPIGATFGSAIQRTRMENPRPPVRPQTEIGGLVRGQNHRCGATPSRRVPDDGEVPAPLC